jgi:hypothetical protein
MILAERKREAKRRACDYAIRFLRRVASSDLPMREAAFLRSEFAGWEKGR